MTEDPVIINCDQTLIKKWMKEKEEAINDPLLEGEKEWNDGFRRALEIILSYWGTK